MVGILYLLWLSTETFSIKHSSFAEIRRIYFTKMTKERTSDVSKHNNDNKNVHFNLLHITFITDLFTEKLAEWF